jgi:hypothetical protein
MIAIFAGTPPTAQRHQRLVHRDLPQPAPERTVRAFRSAAAAKLADPVDDLEHGVLQHVRRLLALPADPQRQREHRALEPAVDLLERRGFAPAHACEQRVRDVDGETGRSGGHLIVWMRRRAKPSQPAAFWQCIAILRYACTRRPGLY